MAEVCLIFPPTVSSGFGRYYPASAVLAAWLAEHGISCRQLDLNTELALRLIAPGFLAEAGAGRFFRDGPAIAPGAMPAVAARLLARNAPRLFDSSGRHDFADPKGPGFLVHELAKPISIDCAIEDIAARRGTLAWQLAFYEDLYAGMDPAALADPEAVLTGITVAMGPQLAPALVLAAHIRRQLPDTRIVLGGPALSLLPEADLAFLLDRFAAVDAIVRYDGELPLLELVRQAQTGEWRPDTVANCSARGEAGIVHAPLKPGPSLHTLPDAIYDPALIADMQAPELGIVQARGCYWGECAYCDYVELYGASRPFRSRTAESLVDEMARQKAATGATRFTLITEAIPPGFSLRFARLLIERKLGVTWNSFAMVDHRFTPEHLELMARSGCDHLVIGLETMTDRVLKLVRKAASSADNLRFLRDAAAAGIRLYINLIPDLPSTTHAEAMAALAMLAKVKDCIAHVAIFPFEPTRSSDVGRDPGAFGLVVRSTTGETGQAEFTSNHLNATDPAMTDAERQAAIAAFRDFAAEVNARLETGHLVAADFGPAPANIRFRLAEEDIDIVVADDRAQLFNWRQHRGWEGPRGVAALAARLGGGPFGRDDFFGLTGDGDVGAVLWRDLTWMGVIQPVAS